MGFYNLFVTSVVLYGFVLSINASDLDRCPKQIAKTIYVKTYGDHCYQFNNFERRWTDAQTYCERYSGHLVVIKDQGVQNFIMSSLRSLNWNRKGVWIGANDRRREMHWEWVTGERITYNNFASGQPSCEFFCMEDCGQLRLTDNGKWHDYPCNSFPYLYSFVCQYDMLPETTTTTTTTTNPPTTTTEEQVEIVHTNLLKNKSQSALNNVLKKTTATPTSKTTTTMKAEQNESIYKVHIKGADHQTLEKYEDGHLSTGIVVALILGILLGLVVGVCFGVVCIVRRRRKKPEENESVSSGYANPYYGEVSKDMPFLEEEDLVLKDETVVVDSGYNLLPSLSLNNPTYGEMTDTMQYDCPKPCSINKSSNDTYENVDASCDNVYEDIDHIKAVIAMNEAAEKKEEEDRYVAMPTRGASAY